MTRAAMELLTERSKMQTRSTSNRLLVWRAEALYQTETNILKNILISTYLTFTHNMVL